MRQTAARSGKVLDMKLFVATLSLAALCAAANLPRNSVRGNYVEARTADVYTGPCFAMSEVNLTGDLAMLGWQIEQGSFDGVDLSGLSVVGVVHASATLGDPMASPYPAQAVIIVDSKGTPEQQVALKRFAQRMAGDLLQTVVRLEVSPITFDVRNNNIHTRSVTMQAGKLAKIETRSLAKTDQVCHNEDVWYQPLTAVDHAMAAYTEQHAFGGQGLGTNWSYPGKRGSFVGTFHLND